MAYLVEGVLPDTACRTRLFQSGLGVRLGWSPKDERSMEGYVEYADHGHSPSPRPNLYVRLVETQQFDAARCLIYTLS